MLYGSKEILDGNRVATIVGAADTVVEFVGWVDAVKGQTEGRNWEETYASSMLDHMQNPFYKGFKHSVLAVYHTDEEQREAFWTEWSIQERQSAGLRDRQLDMLHDAKEERRVATESEEDRNKTIEERAGLDVLDPWDRRTDEEKEEDAKIKEQMKKMRESGELSGDSFGGADKQREARPGANNVPGAYGRTQAIDALKSFQDADDTTDYDAMDNDQLKDALSQAGVPDIKGVYDDDAVPQKAKGSGDIFVDDINGSRNEDGSFDIDSITAHKRGGEIDEVEKAAREAAHNANVAEKKKGRGSFSPDDFAAVLRGDGSADSVVHVEGEDRQRRGEGMSRPTLSDHAEAARAEHQAEQAEAAKNRRAQARKEADVKARGERDRGIFRGADLVQDEDPTAFDDLPEEVRELLEKNGLKRDEIAVKDYPYNSELGGRALLPGDTLTPDGMKMVGGHNITVEGSMTMNGPGVFVVSREDSTKDGYGIYARKRLVKVQNEGGLDLEQTETKVDIWMVRIRAN
jgi:hypothetical protein